MLQTDVSLAKPQQQPAHKPTHSNLIFKSHSGYFGSPTWDDASSQWTACTACTPIANGQVEPNNQISCTSADDTQGEGNFVCDYGYTFVEGVADSCSEASCPASAIDGTATCSCTPSTQYSTLSFAGGAWSGDCIGMLASKATVSSADYSSKIVV